MKPKFILCLALVMSGGLFGCASIKPSVRLEPCQPPKIFEQSNDIKQIILDNEKHKREDMYFTIYADANYQFGCVRNETNDIVLVFSQACQRWQRITEVSLKNTKLGHNPRSVPVYWDFSKSYQGKEYAPLPLRTGSDGLSGYFVSPDKIEYDGDRAVYLLWFTTEQGAVPKDDTVPTKLEIRKKDLDEAFKSQ